METKVLLTKVMFADKILFKEIGDNNNKLYIGWKTTIAK